MDSLLAVRGIERTSMRFRRQLVALAGRIGASADSLAAVMSFETGHTFDPAVRNPKGSATGLIQFTERTAKGLGTTTAKLARMTATQQLPFVERFFVLAGVVNRMHTPTDTYLGVFAPAFVGRGPDVPIYSEPSRKYEDNKALDVGNKGFISTTDAALPVLRIIAAAEARPRVTIEPRGPPSRSVAPFFLFGFLVYGIWRFKSRGPMMRNS